MGEKNKKEIVNIVDSMLDNNKKLINDIDIGGYVQQLTTPTEYYRTLFAKKNQPLHHLKKHWKYSGELQQRSGPKTFTEMIALPRLY